jgi:hypothetical protein
MTFSIIFRDARGQSMRLFHDEAHGRQFTALNRQAHDLVALTEAKHLGRDRFRQLLAAQGLFEAEEVF